jgi:hypothetical protein
MLTDPQVKKFQELYKKHFGEEISRKNAYAKGVALLQLVGIVYKPMTKDELKKVEDRRKENLVNKPLKKP